MVGSASRRAPPVPATVTDLGCGTGSPRRVARAGGLPRPRARSVRPDGRRRRGEGGGRRRRRRRLARRRVVAAIRARLDQLVLARHMLRAVPDPASAHARWIELLADGGRLVLLEGAGPRAPGSRPPTAAISSSSSAP